MDKITGKKYLTSVGKLHDEKEREEAKVIIEYNRKRSALLRDVRDIALAEWHKLKLPQLKIVNAIYGTYWEVDGLHLYFENWSEIKDGKCVFKLDELNRQYSTDDLLKQDNRAILFMAHALKNAPHVVILDLLVNEFGGLCYTQPTWVEIEESIKEVADEVLDADILEYANLDRHSECYGDIYWDDLIRDVLEELTTRAEERDILVSAFHIADRMHADVYGSIDLSALLQAINEVA